MNFYSLGWSDHWKVMVPDTSNIARICSVHRSLCRAMTANGEINLYLSGKFQTQAVTSSEYPAVGDWVTMSPSFIDEQNQPAAIIAELLPRRSKISRVGAGASNSEQVIAANVDYAFVVTSANRDTNVNRLHRYLLLAQEGGVQPIVILSKVDLCSNYQERVRELQRQLGKIVILPVSVENPLGIEELRSYLPEGSTGVFVGSSGVGKSTLINKLLGLDVQVVNSIREQDNKGRHTTTSRELFFIPGGGMIIDTPGLREVQVFGSKENLQSVFRSIGELSRECRFSDCSHTSEPGCAIKSALESGELASEEFTNYEKLLREIEHSNRKMSKELSSNQKKKWKSIAVSMRKKRKLEGR